MDKTCALVLAAGDGKRMKSRHPKVLCEVLFKPMLSWVIDSCRLAEIEELCVVVAPDADEVRAVLPEGCRTAEQAEKLGTGHAVMMAADFLEDTGIVRCWYCAATRLLWMRRPSGGHCGSTGRTDMT